MSVSEHGLGRSDEWASHAERLGQRLMASSELHLDAELAGELAVELLAGLTEALREDDPAPLADAFAYARVLLGTAGMNPDAAGDLLDPLRRFALTDLSLAKRESVEAIFKSAEDCRPDGDNADACGSETAPALENLRRSYIDALLAGRRQDASAMILQAADGGAPVRDIYLHVFQNAQWEIGLLWQRNEISVAKEHYCTAATQLIMSQLYPRIFETPKSDRVLVAACTGGELHEIGIRMVADFFEMEGWHTYYIGASTPVSDICDAVRDNAADLLAVSSTMAFHISAVRDLIAAVRRNADASLPILAGGYPFRLCRDLWRQVGADGTADNALQAVAVGNHLLRRRQYATPSSASLSA